MVVRRAFFSSQNRSSDPEKNDFPISPMNKFWRQSSYLAQYELIDSYGCKENVEVRRWKMSLMGSLFEK